MPRTLRQEKPCREPGRLQIAVASIRHEDVAAAVVREAIDRVSGE